MQSCMTVNGCSGPWWSCTEPSHPSYNNITRYAAITTVARWHGNGTRSSLPASSGEMPSVLVQQVCLAFLVEGAACVGPTETAIVIETRGS